MKFKNQYNSKFLKNSKSCTKNILKTDTISVKLQIYKKSFLTRLENL